MPPPPPPATADLYETLQRYQLLLLAAGRRLWRRMSPAEFDGSWLRIAPQMTAFTAGAQLATAQAAAAYVPAVLEQQGIDPAAEARVRPEAFSGVAFDGRPLDTLLGNSVNVAKHWVSVGYDGGDALAQGQKWLDMTLQTVVTDAGRDMTAAEIAVRPQVTSWVRMVNPPCCSRCAVLAGVVYKWNKPNPRHPRCDCFTLPTTVAKGTPLLTDPAELARQGAITDLTVGQRKRIDDGANLIKVLNESRDRWRQGMAVRRKAARAERKGLQGPTTWGTSTPTPLPDGGIQDFLSHLTSQVEALKALRDHGITE